ncbi:MAG TPA: purine-nucleoside phosphorylase [Ignavibacteria bacterium]|jgi:purine-nucleoside phosphorylase
MPDRRAVNDTISFIRGLITDSLPNIGIILGTGLGGLVKDIHITHKIDYKDIPHFPVSTVESHHGYLIFGTIAGKNCVIMQGRFHFYEGYLHDDITYPVQVMAALGLKNLIISNACGGLNPIFHKADLMIMRDHINFHFTTPFRGNGYHRYCNRHPYDRDLINLAEGVALENEIKIQKGVYLSLHGPHLETRAEYHMVRKLGADAVGMSTIPEALQAVNHNMKVIGLSIITDMGLPDILKPAALHEILETAAEAEPNLTLLTEKIIEKMIV